MKKVVLAIDSFKGCLSSLEVENAAEVGILKVFPDCMVVKTPITDGGDGMLDVWKSVFNCNVIQILAHDPLMRLKNTEYVVSEDGTTAIIESAKICGLTLLPSSLRNPMQTTSYGLGEIILDAISRGCKRCIVGLGGSATNDGGLGMLQALGFNAFDDNNNLLGFGAKFMSSVCRLENHNVSLSVKEMHFTIAYDVNIPLLGKTGCTYIFAPQKGADNRMVQTLEKGMQSFSNIIKNVIGRDISYDEGVGAAGGLGAAFKLFPLVNFISGINLLLDSTQFDTIIENADYVVTGEGRIDKQTLMGKVSWGILQRARVAGVPVIAICGQFGDQELFYDKDFKCILPINPIYIPRFIKMLPDFAAYRITKMCALICKKEK